jgi:hypothetical protein
MKYVLFIVWDASVKSGKLNCRGNTEGTHFICDKALPCLGQRSVAGHCVYCNHIPAQVALHWRQRQYIPPNHWLLPMQRKSFKDSLWCILVAELVLFWRGCSTCTVCILNVIQISQPHWFCWQWQAGSSHNAWYLYLVVQGLNLDWDTD